jgi:DNA-binding IclR family transcriptional regulator
MLNTIDRTGKVLDLFTSGSPTWGVSEIATVLNLPKSTTFDIVASLAKIGFLQRTSDDRYRLGWRMLVISRRLLSTTFFTRQAHRIVVDLANRLDAAVTVGAWDAQGVVCIAHASTDQSERLIADGAHLPDHASALGKVLLAHLPWARVEERIERCGLTAHTQNTIVDHSILRSQLAAIRHRDVAIEHGEYVPGRSCVAVGIYQHEHIVGALSISTPTAKLSAMQNDYVRIARRTAHAMRA